MKEITWIFYQCKVNPQHLKKITHLIATSFAYFEFFFITQTLLIKKLGEGLH